MAKIFIVADTDKQNRPKDLNDLEQRFWEVRQRIPQPAVKAPGNNMNFAEKAFTLFKDCGLITKKMLSF